MGLYDFFLSHPAISRSKLLVISEKITKKVGAIKIFESSGYERVVSSAMKHFVKEGDFAIDIGSHYGYHTVKMAEFSKKGTIFSFEPEYSNFLELRKNTKNIHNVKISPYALSNEVGQSKLYVSELSSVHSLSYKPARFIKEQTIKTSTLDKLFLNSKYSEKIVLIKIDVEGSELKVLQGGKNLLKNNNIVLILEFFPQQWIDANIFPGTFDFLKELGYKKFYDLNEHLRKVIKVSNPKILSEYQNFVDYTNLLCIKS